MNVISFREGSSNNSPTLFSLPTQFFASSIPQLASPTYFQALFAKKSVALLGTGNVPHKSADFKSSKKRIRFHGPADSFAKPKNGQFP